MMQFMLYGWGEQATVQFTGTIRALLKTIGYTKPARILGIETLIAERVNDTQFKQSIMILCDADDKSEWEVKIVEAIRDSETDLRKVLIIVQVVDFHQAPSE